MGVHHEMGVLLRRCCVAALAALALTACGGKSDVAELKGQFGAGSVGPTVDENSVTQIEFTTGSGAVYGLGQFDALYFTPVAAPDPVAGSFGAIANVADGVSLSAVRIVGRPDTPCRYRAALLARDDGFSIEASGDRTNAGGIEFHEVDLHANGQYVSLYCARLAGNSGVQISALNGSPTLRDSIQLKFVLNSIR